MPRQRVPRIPLRYEILDVTPELAKQWLEETNTQNRDLRETVAERYAEDMATGDFGFAGDPIAWDYNGVLMEGQHRLRAVVLSGKTIKMMCIWGLEPKMRDHIGEGKARTLNDILKMRQEANFTALGAAIRLKWRVDTDSVQFVSRKPSNAQTLRTLNNNPGLREAVRQSRRLQFYKCSQAVLAVCYHEFALLDPAMAQEMFDRLADGTNLKPNDPIRVLRSRLEKQKEARSHSVVIHALMILAWNAWRDGRHIANLTWRPDQDFPTPR